MTVPARIAVTSNAPQRVSHSTGLRVVTAGTADGRGPRRTALHIATRIRHSPLPMGALIKNAEMPQAVKVGYSTLNGV